MATKVSERPTCKCCGRPLKPVMRYRLTQWQLTDQQKTMAGCWPRTIKEAEQVLGFKPERVKREPRPICEFLARHEFVPGMKRIRPPSNEVECVITGHDDSDLIIASGTAESGRFGYQGSGQFCTIRCGYEWGLAMAREVERREALSAKHQTPKG